MLNRISTGFLVILLLGTAVPRPSYALTTKDAVVTIFGVGAAGALVGLSTLSFRSLPQNHFRNIWMGASLGLVVGVGITAYLAATSDDLLDEENLDNEEPIDEEGTKLYRPSNIAKEFGTANKFRVDVPVVEIRF